ncbi:GFA family protein [Fulvimarina sp. MAC3]|uniref:GFA family protein n=1 Tax=Fulvimarina sp. MAC3 TaxID=3148887 RepID=UPI0031FE2F69
MRMNGGCQCGAIRFACEPEPSSAHICHCRMCQKAVGNLFAALVRVKSASLVWKKAEPKWFASSNMARRGFCPECGTPLGYRAPDGLFLTIGVFDDPGSLPPCNQYGVEARHAFVAGLGALPESRTDEDVGDQPYLADVVSFQHPDRPEVDGEKPPV